MLPAGPAGTASIDGTDAWTITKSSKNPEKAQQLIEFYLDADVQKRQVLDTGWLPIRLSVLGDPEVQAKAPNAAVVLEQAKHPYDSFVTADYNEVTVAVGTRDAEGAAGPEDRRRRRSPTRRGGGRHRQAARLIRRPRSRRTRHDQNVRAAQANEQACSSSPRRSSCSPRYSAIPIVDSTAAVAAASPVDRRRGLADVWVGLANFQRLFADAVPSGRLRSTRPISRSWKSFWSSLISLGVALLLNHPMGRFGLFRIMLIVPWAIAPVANAVLWKWILNANYGMLNGILTSLGLIDYNQVWLGTPFSALNFLLIVDVWKSVPFVALLMLAGLQRVPADRSIVLPIWTARGRWQSFRNVTLPSMRGIIAIAIVLQTIWSLRVFDLIFVLTRGGPADATVAAELPRLSRHLQLPRSRLRLGDRQRHLRRSPSCSRRSMSGCSGRASPAAYDELRADFSTAVRDARALVLLGLALFVVWSAAPIVWLVLSSVLEQHALIQQPPDLSPAEFHACRISRR